MPTNNSINSQDPIQVSKGGTGLNTVAQGDLLIASASNTLASLPKDTNATRYLSNTGTNNAPAYAQVDLSNGVTGTLPVGNGGLGVASTTAYGVLAGGTSSTSAIQNCGAGTSGQILKSNGNSALPSFVAPSSVGGSMVLLQTITFDNTASSYNITSNLSSTYSTYKIIGTNIQGFNGGSNSIALRVSTNGGSSFETTGYSVYGGVWNFATNALSTFPSTDGIRMCYLDLTGTSDYVSFEAMLTGYLASTGIQVVAENALKPTDKMVTTFGNYIGTVNGLQIININAVNIVSGKVSIYGIVQ